MRGRGVPAPLSILPIIRRVELKKGLVGTVAHGVSIFPEFFVLVSLCFISLQAVYQLSGPVCKSTYTSSYSFISCFVIDFCPLDKL